MRRFLPALTFSLFSAVAGAAPQVIFVNGAISAVPDPARPPVREQLDVLEKEGCSVQQAARRIALGGGCDFLRGLYRYAFNDKESKKTRTVFVEFTAMRSGQGHAFIAAAPLELVTH